MSSVALLSLFKSVSSGAEDCKRKAISYAAMRVAISGSPTVPSLRRFSSLIKSSESRCALASMPAGLLTFKIGSPVLRKRTPV